MREFKNPLRSLERAVNGLLVIPSLIHNIFSANAYTADVPEDYLKLATDHNVPVHIATNGIPLTPKKNDAILNSSVYRIHFSIDAANQNTYSKLQPSTLLSKVERNIDRLLKARGSQASSRVEFCFVENDTNKGEFRPFLNKWVGKVDLIMRNYEFILDENSSFVAKSFSRSPHGFCLCVYNDLFIAYDGLVYNCHTDSLMDDRLPYNAWHNSIISIYYSNEMLRKRALQAQKKSPSTVKPASNPR